MRFKKNIAEAAAKLLLVQSNPTLDPHHAWALVIVRALWRAQNLHSIFPLALTQEELGVPAGRYLAPDSGVVGEAGRFQR